MDFFFPEGTPWCEAAICFKMNGETSMDKNTPWIQPENGWLEDAPFPFGALFNGLFSGAEWKPPIANNQNQRGHFPHKFATFPIQIARPKGLSTTCPWSRPYSKGGGIGQVVSALDIWTWWIAMHPLNQAFAWVWDVSWKPKHPSFFFFGISEKKWPKSFQTQQKSLYSPNLSRVLFVKFRYGSLRGPPPPIPRFLEKIRPYWGLLSTIIP